MTLEERAAETARKQMVLIRQMAAYGLDLCDGCTGDFFDLTTASPGLVLSFYVAAYNHIRASDVPDAMKADMQREIRFRLDTLLRMVLGVVQRDDPHGAVLDLGITLAEAMAMGTSPSGEVH